METRGVEGIDGRLFYPPGQPAERWTAVQGQWLLFFQVTCNLGLLCYNRHKADEGEAAPPFLGQVAKGNGGAEGEEGRWEDKLLVWRRRS